MIAPPPPDLALRHVRSELAPSRKAKRATSVPHRVLKDEDAAVAKDEEEAHVDAGAAIEALGFGRFQVLLFLFVGLVITTEYVEVMLNAFLLPFLREEWNLGDGVDGTVGAATFLGKPAHNPRGAHYHPLTHTPRAVSRTPARVPGCSVHGLTTTTASLPPQACCVARGSAPNGQTRSGASPS